MTISEDGCWIFGGYKRPDGYGEIMWNGKRKMLPHRVAYMVFVGQIPEGLVIDHLCRNPSCINPEHLEAVEFVENVARGLALSAQNSLKTHCLRGHELAGENLRFSNKGERICITCSRERMRNDRLAKPEKYKRYEGKRDRLNNTKPERRKSHCKKGHPLSGENLLVYKGGDRKCKACRVDYMRKWHANRS